MHGGSEATVRHTAKARSTLTLGTLSLKLFKTLITSKENLVLARKLRRMTKQACSWLWRGFLQAVLLVSSSISELLLCFANLRSQKALFALTSVVGGAIEWAMTVRYHVKLHNAKGPRVEKWRTLPSPFGTRGWWSEALPSRFPVDAFRNVDVCNVGFYLESWKGCSVHAEAKEKKESRGTLDLTMAFLSAETSTDRIVLSKSMDMINA